MNTDAVYIVGSLLVFAVVIFSGIRKGLAAKRQAQERCEGENRPYSWKDSRNILEEEGKKKNYPWIVLIGLFSVIGNFVHYISVWPQIFISVFAVAASIHAFREQRGFWKKFCVMLGGALGILGLIV
jgi:hypothetical protein